jgi:hypothetical protein
MANICSVGGNHFIFVVLNVTGNVYHSSEARPLGYAIEEPSIYESEDTASRTLTATPYGIRIARVLR